MGDEMMESRIYIYSDAGHVLVRGRASSPGAVSSQLHLLVEPSKFGSEPPLNRPDAGPSALRRFRSTGAS